ncbi:MAG TPA: hypothetical protein VE954_38035 [Oligoflexus sp.]|uniref:NADase-type glycan-binding domain-containing protein n=1 Tax=Oligoflexus sp. TaxID=1971216 RepID=UPI002D4E7A0A|nr:hypothetical protein [Oligoflexus sp.]HYX38942.1 hypothetical protein [Oligoflexus sp.]
MRFEKEETKTIRISYDAAFDSSGEAHSDDAMTKGTAIFRYLLSTGSGWKGPIKKGLITIQPLGVKLDAQAIQSKLSFQRNAAGSFVHVIKNLEPTTKDDIEIKFPIEPKHRELLFAASTSSFLPDKHNSFKAEQLGDDDTETAWIEGVKGSGIGETVTLTDIRGTPNQLAIFPGYGRSRELYFANNRVASLNVRINDKDSFVATFPDELRPWHVIELPPIQGKWEKIELRIQGVYKGKKYDDTAISGVSLRESLERPTIEE